MKTVIMAGGKGTRISQLFPDIPKPLIPLSRSIENAVEEKRPVLEWEICSLVSQGFTDIVLTVGYKAQYIIDYFGTGEHLGANITYWIEDIPLGNAGSLIVHRAELGSGPFLLLIADALFDVDFNRMVNFHKEKNALVTLFTHPNSHPYDSSVLVADSQRCVTSWLSKDDARPKFYKNRVNAGLHVIDSQILDMSGIDADRVGKEDENGKIIKVDMDRQLLKPLCNTGRMFAYDSSEYCKDMGTPERFVQVSRDFQNGIVAAKNLSKLQKAIFLDRDGTINKYVGFLRDINEFELLTGVAKAVKLINESGYLCIVVTNQPVIARGEVTVEKLDEIHYKMETLLGETGAYVDGLYYCPHHPDKGFKGEVEALKFDCDCRKPKPGLILQAAKDFNISLENSWMIGDGKRDIECGKNVGCRTVLLTGGESGDGEFGQDYRAEGLLEAVEMIVGI
nr:HAD-IIIA family hydrolase [uncultured Acetatifactor sp.]